MLTSNKQKSSKTDDVDGETTEGLTDVEEFIKSFGVLSTLRTIDHELVNNTPVHELVNKKKIRIFSVHKNFQKFFDHKNCDLKKFMRSKTNFCEQSKNYAINKKIM